MAPPTETPTPATTPTPPITTTPTAPLTAPTRITPTPPTLPPLPTLKSAYSPHRTHLQTTSRTALSEIRTAANLPAITLAHSLARVRLHGVDRHLAGLGRDIRAFSYAIEQGVHSTSASTSAGASGTGTGTGHGTLGAGTGHGTIDADTTHGCKSGSAGGDRLNDLSLLHDAIGFHNSVTSEVEDVKTDLRIAMNRRKMEVVEGRVRGVSLGGVGLSRSPGGLTLGRDTLGNSTLGKVGEVHMHGRDTLSKGADVHGRDTPVKDGGRTSAECATARESSSAAGTKKTSTEDVGEMAVEAVAKLLSLSEEEVGKMSRERLAKMVETQRVVDEVRRKIGEIRRVVGGEGEGERRRTW